MLKYFCRIRPIPTLEESNREIQEGFGNKKSKDWQVRLNKATAADEMRKVNCRLYEI